MKRLIMIVIISSLAGCRGEPVPRDYQNAPPAMTHPPQSAKETPAANGMQAESPHPSSGAEGTVAPYEPVAPPTTATSATTATSVVNAPPVTTTTGTAATTTT